MKGLNKIVLVSAIAAISAGAQAELKSLDDASMGELTGQSGITIDLDATVEIAEIAYQDAGFIAIKDVKIGGAGTTTAGLVGSLDNIRINIDVADGIEAFEYGTSRINEYATTNLNANLNGGAQQAGYAGYVELATLAGGGDATAIATKNAVDANAATVNASWVTAAAAADDAQVYGDGDLVIHLTATDLLDNPLLVGGDFATAIADMRDAVDFGMAVGSVSLEESEYIDADGAYGTAGNSTTLVSNIAIDGLIGPIDIVIDNNGDGVDADGVADSKINVSAYFEIRDMDMDINIAGVSIRDMKVHNNRGDITGLNGSDSLGFAHAKLTIAAVTDGVKNTVIGGDDVDGISINLGFKGDVDVTGIKFGDSSASIGSVYMTDVVVDATVVVSAH